MDKGIGVHSMPSFLLKAAIYYLQLTRAFYLFGVLRNIGSIRSKGFFRNKIMSSATSREILLTQVLFSDRFWLIATEFIWEFEDD